MNRATRGTGRSLLVLSALVLAGCGGGADLRADGAAIPPAGGPATVAAVAGTRPTADAAADTRPTVAAGTDRVVVSAAVDDLVFIHHSVGQDWLDRGLHAALVAKHYIDERSDITYGTRVVPDAGRPDSLGPVAGDSTDMRHWVLWFNDYLAHVKQAGSASGVNSIIMFKSCFPNSDIFEDGTEPGDPFGEQTLADYKAIYRHPSGPGGTYTRDGRTYKALEDVFAANPDTLFIVVSAPPLSYAESSDANARRARVFNDWLKDTWLKAYDAAHPKLNNVAVFDLFNVLANPDSGAHPDRLRAAYGGTTGDSHPNSAGDAAATRVFATARSNFIDAAWAAFVR